MKNLFRVLVVTSMLATTTSFAVAATVDPSQKIAEVDGKSVTRGEVDKLLQRIATTNQIKDLPSFDNLKSDEKLSIVKQIASDRLLTKEIEDSGIAKEESFKEQMKEIEAELLRREFLNRKIKQTVNEEAAKAKYQTMAEQVKGKDEVKVSHILVESEAEATKIIAELKKKPGQFAAIARKQSKDTGSASKGGELGYKVLGVGNSVPEFESAVQTMKKGELSAKPVKTSFGYHVIKVEDRRAAQLPAFDKMKPIIEQSLAEKAVKEYMQSLADKAKVEMTAEKQ